MRKQVLSALVSALFFATMSTSAVLATPGTGAHFVSASDSLNSVGQLVTTFKEAGLGNGQDATVRVSTHYEATWACQNRGGGYAPGLQRSFGDTGTSATFTADRNGAIEGTLVAPSIWPPAEVTCPSGQTGPLLASVAFSSVVLEDLTYGLSTPLADQGGTYITLPTRGAR